MTDWISPETEAKEEDFRGVLNMHVGICKAIGSRFPTLPYLYADLYAGPGHLEFDGRRFLGSPLIAQELLTKHSLPYLALHFERDLDTAARLCDALGSEQSVFATSCQVGFATWLEHQRVESNRYGLIYSDPINAEIPHELLNEAAAKLPRVDILSYVAANQYKRRRGVDPSRPFLSDHIRAIEKKIVLIREPIGKWQWTFILWSNWVKFPEWQRRGFYRLDSAKGESILERLDLSKRESHEAANDALPIDLPYNTYREYLQHPRFLRVKAQVFARSGGTCERCGQRPSKDPHHLRYPPWGEFDVPENLIAICHECHCEIHGKAS